MIVLLAALILLIFTLLYACFVVGKDEDDDNLS